MGKRIKDFKTFKNYRVNEELLGGLFKGIKNKLSIGFSKMFGSAKEADKIMDMYKTEVLNVGLKKKEAMKAYAQYIKDVKDGGEKDDNKLKELQKNLDLADKNYDKQIELIKQKFDLKFKEVIEDEKNPKIQNYITLKKIEMQQELLNSEINTLLTDSGLTEADVKTDPVFTKLLKEINDKSLEAKKMVEEQTKILSDKGDGKKSEGIGFNIEAAKKAAEENKIYLFDKSPLKNHKFEKDEKVVYFSKTNYLANKLDYKGTEAQVIEDKGDVLKVKTPSGTPEINKASLISSESYDKKKSEEESKKEDNTKEI